MLLDTDEATTIVVTGGDMRTGTMITGDMDGSLITTGVMHRNTIK